MSSFRAAGSELPGPEQTSERGSQEVPPSGRLSRRSFVAAAALITAVPVVGAATPAQAQSASDSNPQHAPAEPDFGPNVKVFDPNTPVAEVQSALDAAAAEQVPA